MSDDVIPLAQLTTMLVYPQEVEQVVAFYNESEKLVRFLSGADKKAFGDFLEALSRGARFESGLTKAYGTRYSNMEDMEEKFKQAATSPLIPAIP